MVNLTVREFSKAIIDFVNQSPLPIEIKRLCINDIAAQLQVAADERIRDEILERDNHTLDNIPTALEQEAEHEHSEGSPEDTMEEQDGTGNK